MSVTAWIDLRDNVDRAKLKLATVTAEDGRQRRYLFIVGLSNQSVRWARAQELLGFVASPRGKYLSRMVRDGEQLKASMFQSVWPNAIRAQMPVEDVRLNLAPGKQLRVAQPASVDSGVAGPTAEEREVAMESGVLNRLGRNADGEEVFVNAAGIRYFKRVDGSLVYESEHLSAESFLRAGNGSGLDKCADGFVQCLLRGEPQHSRDLDQFILTTTGAAGPHAPEIYEKFSVLIDAALVRSLTRAHDTAQDAYGDANRSYDMLPPYLGGQRGAGAMPLPVAVMAQRLLGDTRDKRIVVPNAWDGASFAFMAPGTKIMAYTGSKNLSPHVQEVRQGEVEWQGQYSARGELDAEGIFFNADPVIVDGLRQDYRQAFACARTLAQQARAVFVLAAEGAPGEIDGQCQTFMQALANRYQIECAVEVPASLCAKTGTLTGIRIIAIKNARPAPDAAAPERFGVVYSWDELKAHVDEVIATVQLREAEGDGIDVERATQDNDFQRPYLAFSKVGEAITMVPKNLQGPLQEALTNLERLHGPVDDFVEHSLGLGPNTLSQRFSPEQVDAIALSLARIKNGKGIIICDETGIGKGRTLSAAATAALIEGKKIIFVTDRANLFSDLVRDLRDIGEWGRFRPLVMNADVNLIDVISNEVIAEGTKAAQMKHIIREKQSLDDIDANIVFTTYSQIAQADSQKADWLLQQAKGALVIVDEAHIAAGSNSNISSVIIDLVTQADGVIYSSATWAKSSENLHIYSRAFPDSINIGTLSATMRTGGEAFSEVFSSMLAKDGAFLRREHDLSRIEFAVEVDAKRTERNSAISDSVAEIMSAMTFVSGEISRMLVKLNSDTVTVLRAARAAREASIGVANENSGRVFKSSFGAGSVLYQVMRRTLAVLNADNAVDLALRATQNNRKPVIVFEDTGESFLKRIIDEEIIPGIMGEADTVPDAVRVPNIKDFMRHIMKRLGVVSTSVVREEDVQDDAPVAEIAPEEGSQEEAVDLDAVALAQDRAIQAGETLSILELPGITDEMQANYREGIERIMKMIDELPPVPLNVVDLIRARLEFEGLRCGELSGRSVFQVPAPGVPILPITDTGWGGQVWPLIRRTRKKTEVNKTVWEFNNGELDVVLINRSAAAGISLHSSPRFGDSRRRELIELQIPENSTDRIQLYGRVNRYDQVIPPIISIATTGILGEVRQLMMQNKKLARLSANIRSSRDNAAEIKMIPDLLNVVGEDVARRYLEDNGGIRARLGISSGELESEGSRGGSYPVIQKMTSRIALLRVAEQKVVYDDLYEMYEDTLSQYEMEGENPLKPREMNVKAKVVSEELVMGIDMEGIGSSFDGPVILKKLEWTTDYRPIKLPQLVEMVRRGREELLKLGHAQPAQEPARDAQELRIELLRAQILATSDPVLRARAKGARWHSDALVEFDLSKPRTLSAMHAIATTNAADGVQADVQEDELGVSTLPQISIDQVSLKLTQILEAKARLELVGTEFVDLESALRAEGKNPIKRAHAKKLWTQDFMAKLVPGCEVWISPAGQSFQENFREKAIVVGLKSPAKGREAQLSRWKIDYVVAGDEKPRTMSLLSLMRGAQEREHGPGVYSDHKVYGDVFSDANETRLLKRTYDVNWVDRKKHQEEVLDGNMYMASDWAASSKMGQGIIYTDERGARHRGVLIKRKNNDDFLTGRMPVRLWSAPMLTGFVMAVFNDRFDHQDDDSVLFATSFKSAMSQARDKGAWVRCHPEKGLILQAPKSDAGRIARALRADLKSKLRSSVDGYDLMTKVQKEEVAGNFPKIILSSKKGAATTVTVQCAGLALTKLALDMLTRACGLEIYVSATSPYAPLARDVQSAYFSRLKEEWLQRYAAGQSGPGVPEGLSDGRPYSESMRACAG